MVRPESVSLDKIKHKKKMTKADIAFYVCVYAFFILFMAVTLYPVFNRLMYSFADRLETEKGGAFYLFPRMWSLRNYKELLFPNSWIWENYREIDFDYPNFLIAAKVTLARTIIGTLTALISNAFLAFILSRKRFVFRHGLSLFWIIAMFIQGSVVPLVPTYMLYRLLRLSGSFWVYIIPYFVSVFNVMVIRTYMQSIPDSFEEAAQLEGAGYMRIFISIFIPLCKPVLAATALFLAAFHWNSWFDSLLYNRFEPEYTTLTFQLMKYFNEVSVVDGRNACRSPTPVTIKATAAVVTMLPLIVAYPFLKKYFVTGLSISGIKD